MRDDHNFSDAQQRQARPVSGGELEQMGKSAAERWSVGAYPSLHEAVVGTVKCARLSPEQVKRVVEFANTTAYLTEFRKEGMGHKYIDFGEGGPANPSTVLQDLNDGGGGTVFDTGKTASLSVNAYATPPKPYNPLDGEEKVAVTLAEVGLAGLAAGGVGGVAGALKAGPSKRIEGFARGAAGATTGGLGGGVGSAIGTNHVLGALAGTAIGAVTGYQLATIGLGNEKKASFVGDPFAEAYELRDTLEGQAGHVKEALRQESRNHAHFSADLYEEVKRAALSGYSLGDVAHALSSASIDDVFVKAAMAAMIDPLLEQGVFLSPEKLAASFTKVAGGTPDLTHPMVQAFQGWCASLEKSASLRKEAQELEEGVATLNSFIRKQAGGLIGAAKKVFGASADIGGHIGAGAGHLLAGAGGREAGRSVGRAVGYAAPLVGAHELYRRNLKGSQTFQSAKGTALSLVPGTQEYYMAEQGGDPYAMMGGY